MNNAKRIKELLTPSVVVEHYLGQPIKTNSVGMWFKSPFRNERTASFLVNNQKGIHDFGTSKHYDIISFLQELLGIDFKTAITKLQADFGIIDYGQSSKELEAYLIRKRQEDKQIKINLNKWFYATFINLCKELKMWKKILQHVKGEALLIAYSKGQYVDYLIDIFINATEDEKIELWKEKKEIEKWISYK